MELAKLSLKLKLCLLNLCEMRRNKRVLEKKNKNKDEKGRGGEQLNLERKEGRKMSFWEKLSYLRSLAHKPSNFCQLKVLL